MGSVCLDKRKNKRSRREFIIQILQKNEFSFSILESCTVYNGGGFLKIVQCTMQEDPGVMRESH